MAVPADGSRFGFELTNTHRDAGERLPTSMSLFGAGARSAGRIDFQCIWLVNKLFQTGYSEDEDVSERFL